MPNMDSLSTSDPQQLRLCLEAIARKDREAFRRLYEAAAPKLFGFALRILSRREFAEEVLQESFINIWNSAGGYQASLAAPMTWMATIVRNKAFDMLRRADHTVERDADSVPHESMQRLIDSLESSAPTPGESLQFSEDAAALASCLQRLEARHREAIVMAFYRDLSHNEVAEQMKLPVGTVKTWIRRGLESLRLCLTKPERA
jgi:RNA polymerase sigma factor (sigma-70 family)